MLFNVDECNADYITGWVLGDERRVQIAVNGKTLGPAVIGFPRQDVAAAHPDKANAFRSGFRLIFTGEEFRPGRNDVSIIVAADEERQEWHGSVFASQGMVADKFGRWPLPLPVIQQLQLLLEPSFFEMDCGTEAAEESAIDALTYALERGSRINYALREYVSFLSRMWLQYSAIAWQFPLFNRFSKFLNDTGFALENPVDVFCVQSHPLSILAIAGHLFTLKSWGLEGNYFEFGCFKGYSTSCLSLACHALNIPMDAFDSFQGLPGYGDYKGTFEEVMANVKAFGAPDAVMFHKGFFADSLKKFSPKSIISMFMDVDLEGSARDLIKVFPWMIREGAIFSDETVPENFGGRSIVAQRSETSVLPPVLDAFAAEGRTPTGRHIQDNLGVLWDSAKGIPVLSVGSLRRILRSQSLDAGRYL